jgi:hypothetical protein
MAGKPQSRQGQLATNRQLWRLNKLGRLQIVDEAVCIGSVEAKAVIEAELEKAGQPDFPDTKLAVRWGQDRIA